MSRIAIAIAGVVLILCSCSVLLLGLFVGDQEPVTERIPTSVPLKSTGTRIPTVAPTAIPIITSVPIIRAPVCCVMCSKGKACGDTCIAKDLACKVGQGCACDR